jgi:5'-nucleotidase (lipoprotein e(P4) family)
MRTIVILLAALASACAVAPESPPAGPLPDVNFATACRDLGTRATVTSATRWSRTAAEHEALYLQIFALAEDRLAAAPKPAQPWAIVTDADETILDNTPFQCASELMRHGQFDPKLWQRWVDAQVATATPGATAFIARVHQLGGRVVVVTNRDDEPDRSLSPTRANFHALGLAVDAVLFSLGPNDRDKNRRFKAIARDGIAAENLPPLAVLMYLGDNIGDFPDLRQENPGDRSRFGRDYFVFPNPMYGSFSGNTLR